MKVMIHDKKGKAFELYNSDIYDMTVRLKAVPALKDLSEVELHSKAIEQIDEQYNELYFDIEAEMPKGDYIALVDLGLWNGRHLGYKTFNDPTDILSAFGCDECTVTFDQYNVRSEVIHHDGTNYILFRRFKEDLTKTQKDTFLNLVYSGTCDGKDIKRYTVSIRPYMSKLPTVDLNVKPDEKGVRYAYPV